MNDDGGTEKFWCGPYDVRVAWHREHCPAKDGYNICTRPDIRVEDNGIVVNNNPPTRKEYLHRFAEKRYDGNYWLR
jgi:hypothetical protein